MFTDDFKCCACMNAAASAASALLISSVIIGRKGFFTSALNYADEPGFFFSHNETFSPTRNPLSMIIKFFKPPSPPLTPRLALSEMECISSPEQRTHCLERGAFLS